MTQEAVITKPRTPRRWLPVLVFLATVASSSQMPLAADELTSPDLNLILQRLENVQHQDPAQSRPFEVTREYKVFRGDDKQPTSEVTAQINFVPPDMKTYKIILVRGHSRGEELGEYPPKAPRFGSRTFISPCNLRHWVVCGGTRFLRRYRYSAPLRAVHTCWPQYPSLGSATRCAEIATRDNYWDCRSTENWGVFPGASCAQCSSFRLGKMVRRKIRCPHENAG
jgi:hypothetical protein